MKKKILSLFLCLATVSTLTACKTNVLQNDNALTEPATDTLVTTPVQSDAVNTVCYDTLTEGTKAIYNNLLAGFQNFDEQIVVEGNEADIERAYKNVIADHPEIFYISGLVYKDASNIVSHDRFTVFPSYSETKDSYEDYLKQADAVATEYLAAIETDNKYQIAKSLFRVVAENTSYVKDATHNQDMLSVFLFNQSVCGGYCQGYSYLLQKAGIPCTTLVGKVNDTDHAWTVYILDGKYYMADPTNGDSKFYIEDKETNYTNYAYFNMLPDSTKDYIPGYTNIGVSSDELNYFKQEGLYFTDFNETQIADVISTAIKENRGFVTLCFNSNELLIQAEQILFDRSYITKYINTTSINYIDSDKFNTVTIFL